MNATLDQAVQFLTLIKQKFGSDNPLGRLQSFLDSGLASDMMEVVDPLKVDRDLLREALLLPKLPHPKPFSVVANFGQNVHNVLGMIQWEYQSPCDDFPVTGRLYDSSVAKPLCVPLERTSTIVEIVDFWKRKGFAPADFRETLITAWVCQKPKVYVCALPIQVAAKGPIASGFDFEYWIINRARGGGMHMFTDSLDLPRLNAKGDNVWMNMGGGRSINLKKRDFFIVMVNDSCRRKST